MVLMVVVILVLVAILLIIKAAITPKGTVKIDINDGKKVLDVQPGGNLMGTLAEQKIFLPSACGGKANCGQCKVQVLEGGGEILPTEVGFFNRKQIKEGWRLGCQVKVKDNLKLQMDESALSIKKLTGIPIKYVGVGEKIDDLENFHPDRMADRILGMGDIVSLVEQIQEKIDEKQAEKTSRRLMQGQFDLTDMLSLMKQMNKLGPLKKIMGLVPNAPKVSDDQLDQAQAMLKKTEVIISSMTRQERKKPEMIKTSRKIRIAKGSGTTPKDVTMLLDSFEKMKGQMKMMNNPMMRGRMKF